MKYTIRCKNKWTNTYFHKEVEGEPVEIIPGYEFFLHETSAGDMGVTPEPWTVTEKSTGRVCGMGKTKEEAIKQARANVLGAGDRFPSLIAKMLEVNKTLFPEENKFVPPIKGPNYPGLPFKDLRKPQK